MISNLRVDVLEEILSKVPVTSLRRLRSTCKLWYHHALFKDPGFIKKHSDKTERGYYDVMLIEYEVYSVSSNINEVHLNSRLRLKGNHSLIDPLSNSDQFGIYEAFHCDGLLLCTAVSREHEAWCVVWNPFSGKTRWIRPISQYHQTEEVYALGYNNKELCHNYKILRIISREKLEIYEFSSNSWRSLDVSPHGIILSLGASLKGNTYWVSSPSGVSGYSLLSFDFSTEKFQHLCVPFHKEAAYFSTMGLSVVREEHLSLLLYYTGSKSKIDIWIAKEIETTFASWTKFLHVDLKPGMNCCSSPPISFFINEEKKVAVFCDDNNSKVCVVGEDEYHEVPLIYKCLYLNYWGLPCPPTVFTYVPRFV
ncbi:PREDICTED: putative F-box protein At3g17560 [Camelina sativa]|uniref:F-box protein At3g17560 n=1 Tax=Camelina sativa TaxID=90675 RepID=A0ABM0T1N1_CAMSA|nr:PREDICTED: putative F-box protein At3g17560 [Camelina sativa]